MASKLLKDAIAQLQDDLDLELSDIAGAVKANPRSMARWQSGDTFPQHEYRQRLDALMELRDRISETFGNGKAARGWVHTDNPYLGRMKPVEALRAGRIDSVNAALEVLDSGIYV